MAMKAAKPAAFVLLAFLVGGIASQLPFAFADSSANPLQSIWDAIGTLNNKQEDLQAQIDDLRATIENDRSTSTAEMQGPQSESSIKIELEGGENPTSTIIHLRASNAGPDKAVGVKVTLFYEMPLFEIESVTGEQCQDLSRGIIQCFIGTIDSNEEYPVTIVANAKLLDEKSNIVADISSITTDTNLGNNHVNLQFVTGKIAKAAVTDSGLVPAENENGTNGVDEQNEPVESTGDSQTITDDQSSEDHDNVTEQTENNSNSTQSTGPDHEDESQNGQQQAQGTQAESSEEQNSEESTESGDDDGTEQASQTQSSNESDEDRSEQSTQDEEGGESESFGDNGSGGSNEGEESSQ
jgi:hypothetical protein